MHLSAVQIRYMHPKPNRLVGLGFFLLGWSAKQEKLVSVHFVIVAVLQYALLCQAELFDFTLKAPLGTRNILLLASCAESASRLLRFLSYSDSRFFFRTGVSSSPLLSIQPYSKPKGNRFRRSLSRSLLLLVLAFSDIP